MTIKTITAKAHGITTYWSLTTRSDMLAFLLQWPGLGVSDCLPSILKPHQRLKQALVDTFRRRRDILIHPHKNSEGFSITRLVKGNKSNSYVTDVDVFLKIVDNEFEIEWVWTLGGTDHLNYAERNTLEDDCKNAFDLWAMGVTASSVGVALSNVIRKLGGVPLRPRGGIYWLPQRAVAKWEKVAGSVVNAEKHNIVFQLSTIHDSNSAKAVLKAVELDLIRRFEEIETALSADDLGDRALKTKLSQLRTLKVDIKEYEAILGESFSHIQAEVENTENLECFAAFM